ncbi:MAG: hypothetical protein IT454_13720 [Planctomycetes bacterium]|nr:hypothetical protein [Planctomycetota bacterium]
MAKTTDWCRLCDQIRPLINAHIYPRALLSEMIAAGETPISQAVDASTFPKRVPVGWYDPTILCAGCDHDLLGPLDASGVDFLRLPFRAGEMTVASGVGPYVERPGADARKLKLFAMSLLWRAGVSRRAEFAVAKLGPFEELLRERIRISDPGSLDDFAVAFTIRPNDPGGLMLPPGRGRFRGGGPTVYVMHLGKHTIHLKVDHRRVPDSVRELFLGYGPAVRVAVGDVLGGHVGDILRKFVKARPALGDHAIRRK